MSGGSGLGDWHFSGMDDLPARPQPAPPQPAQPARSQPVPSPTSARPASPARASGLARAGPYELLELLGEGGMGAIWRARHPGQGREVAIKVLHHGAAAPARQRERFLIEARAAGRLKHPHVIAVHDVGEEGGVPFLVMDLVAGESVGQRLKRQGPLPPREAVQLTAQVARALEHAHARQVLHRDVKPSNVLLDPQGQALLGDFGLARLLDSSREGLTRTGDVLGTPGYMAPEQAVGEADERSDVYSTGATLFAMLTGQPPTHAQTVLEFLAQVRHVEAPSVRGLRPEVDPPLDAIVSACLRRDPARRYRTAAELAEELERWLGGESPLGPGRVGFSRPGARRRRRLLLGLALAGLLAAGGTALALRGLPRPRAERALAEAQALALAGDTAGALAGLDSALELEPQDPGLLRARAELRASTRQPGPALVDALALLEVRPDDPQARLLAARCRSDLGRVEEALADCDRLLAADPTLREAWLLRARLQRLRGDSGAAAADVDRAVALGTPGALAARAALRRSLGLRAEALEDYRLALSETPEDPALWRALADLRLETGDPRGARQAAERAVALDPGSPDSWLARSEACVALGELEQAERDCTRAVELAPASAVVRCRRGDVRMRLERWGAALEDYDRGVELDPRQALFWGNRAGIKVQLGDRQGAMTDYGRAAELAPADPRFSTHRGALLGELGDSAGALAVLDQVLARHPDHAEALYYRASALGRLSRWEEARRDTDRLLALRPNDLRGLRLRATLDQAAGRWAESLADLDRLLELAPDELDALCMRGVSRAYAGQRAGATADLRRYLELAPPNHWRMKFARESLQGLESTR